MGKIAQLDNELSNLIAAGEVVEGPYSVVKELVENSVDAGSSSIEVILKDFGMSKITVIDNGEGMDKDDVLLCFSRHATSKIKNEFELFRIKSLGFRGEAIPSIASVSKMTIKSNEGKGGHEVTYKSGKLISENIAPCNKGTTVIVENLFFNTPARLKHIKTPNYELSKVVELITKLAICFNDIDFKLTNDGKQLFSSNASDLRGIMASVYTIEVGKNLIVNEKDFGSYSIRFGLTLPHITRSRKNGVTIIVNNRIVLSNKILNAVLDGYRGYLEVGKYPLAVIKIDIDPLLVDVNVHPNKKEIRISNENELCRDVTQCVKEILDSKKDAPKQVLDIKDNITYEKTSVQSTSYIREVEEISYKQENLFETNYENNHSEETISTSYIQDDKGVNYNGDDYNYLNYLSYIGQLSSTYLLFQYQKSLYLVDQHAAAERVNYEYYIEKLSNPIVNSQPLLIPQILELTVDEFIYVNDHLDKLSSVGFVLDQAGESSFYLREIPEFILKDDKGDGNIIVSYLIEKGEIDLTKYRDDIAKSIACKASIKANENLSASSVESLITQLAKCDNPLTCPHGRPTVVEISNNEIEKMFRRKL